MKPGLLLLLIAVSVGAIGYVELRHQAERETWRAESTRLNGLLDQAEHLAEERAQALSDIEHNRLEHSRASAELATLEAEILDAAAELARLESHRAVAQDRTDKAIDDLKEQVSALTSIELDLASISQRREQLKRDVRTVEERLKVTELEAAERQKRAEALDRDIADLAIRREAILASLEVAEEALVKTAPAEAPTVDEAPAEDEPIEEPLKVAAPTDQEPSTSPVITPAAVVNDRPSSQGDRSLGLYQFGSLSASPEAIAGLEPGASPVEAEDPSAERARADAEDWADNQYLLGMRLLANAEQTSGTRALNDAILAFKAVLGEWPKERDRMRWAIARSDLGYALALLGKRRDDKGLLEEAVVASRDALDQFERTETPLLWAAAQHHLGVSLGGLADAHDDQDLQQASIEALELAIAAFKDAGSENDVRKVEKRLREAYADLPTALD